LSVIIPCNKVVIQGSRPHFVVKERGEIIYKPLALALEYLHGYLVRDGLPQAVYGILVGSSVFQEVFVIPGADVRCREGQVVRKLVVQCYGNNIGLFIEIIISSTQGLGDGGGIKIILKRG